MLEAVGLAAVAQAVAEVAVKAKQAKGVVVGTCWQYSWTMVRARAVQVEVVTSPAPWEMVTQRYSAVEAGFSKGRRTVA